MKFRLTDGGHAQIHPKFGVDARGQALAGEFRKGDILEDDTDLAKRWPEKFERVPDDTKPTIARVANLDVAATKPTVPVMPPVGAVVRPDSVPVIQPVKVDPPAANAPAVDLTATLREMSESDLRKHAKAESVDVRHCKTKDDLINAIVTAAQE